MARLPVKIMRLTGSLLGENQQIGSLATPNALHAKAMLTPRCYTAVLANSQHEVA